MTSKLVGCGPAFSASGGLYPIVFTDVPHQVPSGIAKAWSLLKSRYCLPELEILDEQRPFVKWMLQNASQPPDLASEKEIRQETPLLMGIVS